MSFGMGKSLGKGKGCDGSSPGSRFWLIRTIGNDNKSEKIVSAKLSFVMKWLKVV